MIYKRLLIICVAFVLLFLPVSVASQNYLSTEEESRIMLSGDYYAEYGYAEQEEDAIKDAMNALVNTIVGKTVASMVSKDELLKEISMRAHTSRLRNDGNVCCLAWIHKDSVYITVSKPLARLEKRDKIESQYDSSTLETLLSCKNYAEFRRVLYRSGCIYGDLNSTSGFEDISLCNIAVFDREGNMVAFLAPGLSVRQDMLSGQTVNDPENYYYNSDCSLWYFQIINK